MELKDLRTKCLNILLRCRKGLDLPDTAYLASYYTADGMICLLRYEDNKVYRIEIKEVKDETPKRSSDTTSNY